MLNDTLNFISKLNYIKLINMLKAEMSYWLSSCFRHSFVWGMPYSYSIETSSICNLSCPECPTGKGITHRNNNTMPMEQYQALISQIAPTATYLMLYLQGEPFLNPQIFEMIQLADANKIYTSISTNGHFLNKQNAMKTVTSGLDRIIISLDGVTNDVYKHYRRGGSLEKVLEGVTNLVEAKKALNSQKPFIILQFIVFKHNQHQINEFRILTHSLGVNKAEVKTAQLDDFEHGHPMMTDLEPFSRYRKSGDHFVLRKSIRNSCKRIWSTGVLTSDGVMVPCCYDKAASYAMGTADVENLEILWKGQLFNRYRREVLAHRMKIDICCNCDE